VRRIGRNDHHVKEQHATGLGDQGLNFLAGLAIDGTLSGDVDVTRPAQSHADAAVGHVVDVAR